MGALKPFTEPFKLGKIISCRATTLLLKSTFMAKCLCVQTSVLNKSRRRSSPCGSTPAPSRWRQALPAPTKKNPVSSSAGAPIEVTFYDADFDDEEGGDDDDEARDDFVIYFVGPTPAAIMQVQRDLLVQDMIALMERHFDGSELGEVVEAVDKLFERRFDALVNSMQLGRPPRGPGGSPGGSGHGGGRKPRHLH